MTEITGLPALESGLGKSPFPLPAPPGIMLEAPLGLQTDSG
jgi:hypothetical protein